MDFVQEKFLLACFVISSIVQSSISSKGAHRPPIVERLTDHFPPMPITQGMNTLYGASNIYPSSNGSYVDIVLDKYTVDNIPIREIINKGAISSVYPLKPMSLYATIWDGSNWATKGGHYPINYTYAPFVASLGELKIEGCMTQDTVLSQNVQRLPAVERLTDRFPTTLITQGMATLYGASNIRFNGSYVDIRLDKSGGSGLFSKDTYYHGFFSVSLKLSNSEVFQSNHDELDFELLGHESKSQWVLQTNMFLVDNIPIREIRNAGSMAYAYSLKPMTLYTTIWDGSNWATDGGKYPTDYKYAPFVASLGELKIEGCVVSSTSLPVAADVVCSNNATISNLDHVEGAGCVGSYRVGPVAAGNTLQLKESSRREGIHSTPSGKDKDDGCRTLSFFCSLLSSVSSRGAVYQPPNVERLTDRFPTMPITQGMTTLFGASNIHLKNNGSFMSNSDEFPHNHDEIDFELLGHAKRRQWVLQTNMYGNGSVRTGREEKVYLWFDPTQQFHQYTILWNSHHIVFLVDNIPVREVINNQAISSVYPSKPMSLYATIWDASDWATDGGKYPVNYNYAPFVASLGELKLEGCITKNTISPTAAECSKNATRPSSDMVEGANYARLSKQQMAGLNWAILLHYTRGKIVEEETMGSSLLLSGSSRGAIYQPPTVERLTDHFPPMPITQGSGLVSKNTYYHGFFSAAIKLPMGITSGVVLAFYVSKYCRQERSLSHLMSNSDVFPHNHDEIDFELLGHEKRRQWVLQTNMYGNGSVRTGREEKVYLWFDPTQQFHQYTILWNSHHIVFLVDNIPVREVIHNQSISSVYPSKPMSLYATIWDASEWATHGGKYPVNYNYGPFVASLGELKIEGCMIQKISSPLVVVCAKNATLSSVDPVEGEDYATLSKQQMDGLDWVRRKHMFYSYCKDTTRYKVLPIECNSP
ncbi:Concanavalin A-like lectin/glucanase superfamily [Cynara cardunculus var. scolymus]|uniref:xyloglucan:xyloglucosyl transferase n=1 Tax=Cynara cardunculus var. scolymus TaxID=59895 RepID=A0A124SD78_CYNCS|nr:Concanavalin A-like lectin/glucanase superfamily [Cynara cardunculus var. scolymus]